MGNINQIVPKLLLVGIMKKELIIMLVSKEDKCQVKIKLLEPNPEELLLIMLLRISLQVMTKLKLL